MTVRPSIRLRMLTYGVSLVMAGAILNKAMGASLLSWSLIVLGFASFLGAWWLELKAQRSRRS